MLSFLSARITGLLAKVFTAQLDEEEIFGSWMNTSFTLLFIQLLAYLKTLHFDCEHNRIPLIYTSILQWK